MIQVNLETENVNNAEEWVNEIADEHDYELSLSVKLEKCTIEEK